MQHLSKPTALGKFFTSTTDWTLTFDENRFVVQTKGKKLEGATLLLENLRVKRGILWSTIIIPIQGQQEIPLGGLSNSAAKKLLAEITTVTNTVRYRMRVAALIQDFSNAIKPVVDWSSKALASCKVQLKVKGWLTHEFKLELNSVKPTELASLLSEPEVRQHLIKQPKTTQDAVNFWTQNFDVIADGFNELHVTKQKEILKDFFDKVEKSPLTEEQLKAVVCFDNRLLLVASAGSGKTSTMVAKAAYALKQGYFAPEQMLLLAFNNDAAAELRERIKARLVPLGLPAEKVVAKTFHAFGLDIIGVATGKRPSLAPWVENGRDIETLLGIVDELKDKDAAFRTNWDMFRIVIGQDLPKFGRENDSPDSWNKETSTGGFWSLNNDVVKSRGELLIANWLFYNGVNYKYEAPYQHDTADSAYRQYKPDFYFPDIDAYLEHWAVDENGQPPKEFVGYKEGMAWKKELHARNGTRLLETTMAELWSGKAFIYLAQELPKLGITLDPNPERPVPGRKPIENPRLARTFRSFLTHAKSNRLTAENLRGRLNAGIAGQFRFRHAMFLSLFQRIWDGWEEKLKAEKSIDFDDMLNLASDCVAQGQWHSPFELIMVDEFQDASQARARLVSELVKGPGKCLFAVGDDWQSINRFAGADLAVMTEFTKTFGHAVTMKLETTFRCPQSLCDISSNFVQKNPKQIKKKVRAYGADVSAPVHVMRVDDENKIRSALSQRINEIISTTAIRGRKIQIYILGRYNKENIYVPPIYDMDKANVEFMTVHSSKGLEADYILLPRMTSEILGFPSRIVDDPVMQLAMPGGDDFESAEERRLFYVALTRARENVTLVTLLHKESPFIVELARDCKLQIQDFGAPVNQSIRTEVCPTCQKGFLVGKKGKYGKFLGCSQFPRCRHTQKTIQ